MPAYMVLFLLYRLLAYDKKRTLYSIAVEIIVPIGSLTTWEFVFVHVSVRFSDSCVYGVFLSSNHRKSTKIMANLRQTPLTCSGHTRPVVHLDFSDITDSSYFLISACKGKNLLSIQLLMLIRGSKRFF